MMKLKTLVICLFFMAFLMTSYAQKVKQDDLQKVISTFLKIENKEFKKVEKLTPLGIQNDTTIYVAQFENGGFIILSADYAAPPILGICFNGVYDPENMPGGLLYLMGTYQNSIKSLKDNKIKPTEETLAEWDKYKGNENEIKLKSASEIESRDPILRTTWGQKTPFSILDQSQQNGYHRFCPPGCKAGCVAVAMAQILYHWRWDVNQTGSNTFDGQTVNFSNPPYCWNRMSLTSPDNDNSRLIYHAGVSCNMDYCSGGEDGSDSGSTATKALAGFKNFWGMSSAGAVKFRGFFYFWQDWKSMLKKELDNNRPVLYSGGVHTWVIDGYKSTKMFNCVWGLWDGLYDGYFELGSFNTQGSNFNAGEEMIANLYPATSVINSVSGPSVLTSLPVQYDIVNIADCAYATWNYSSNIQAVYGGNHYITLKAIGNGLGWIDATYVLDGVIHNAPRKEVTCVQ